MIVMRRLSLQQAAARLQSENIPEKRRGCFGAQPCSSPHWLNGHSGQCWHLPWGCACACTGVCWPGGYMAPYRSSGSDTTPGVRAWGSGSWGQVAQPCCQGYPARACWQDRAQQALLTGLGCQPNTVPRCGDCLPASLSQHKSTIIKHEI